MQTRTRLIFAGALAALLACACGGSSTPAGAATSVTSTAPGAGGGGQTADACKLFTQSDATTALGETANAPTSRTTAVSSTCSYTSSSGARVSVDIYRSPDPSTAAKQFQQSFGNIGQPVSGFGDQARASTDGSLLFILKGSTIISISLLLATKQPDVPGAVRTLGTKLLSKI